MYSAVCFHTFLKEYMLSFIWTSQRIVFLFVVVCIAASVHTTHTALRTEKNKNLVKYFLLFVSQLRVYDWCLIWCLKVTQQSRVFGVHSCAVTSDLWERTLTGSLLDLVISRFVFRDENEVHTRSTQLKAVNPESLSGLGFLIIVCVFRELSAYMLISRLWLGCYDAVRVCASFKRCSDEMYQNHTAPVKHTM